MTFEVKGEITNLFCRFRTQVGQGCQLEFVQFFLHQQGSDGGDGFTIAEFGEPKNWTFRMYCRYSFAMIINVSLLLQVFSSATSTIMKLLMH